MNKPLSLKIKELIATGNYSDALEIATASTEQYPRIKIYKDLLDECKTKLPKKPIDPTAENIIGKNSADDRTIDIETFDYHIRKQLEKVRAKEVSPIKAWDNILFLAPSHWPKDPRLTRLVAPSEKALKQHFNRQNTGTLILTGDIKGGAGIAALRVFECLNGIGNRTDILYRDEGKFVIRRSNESDAEIETIDLTQRIYSGIEYNLIEEFRDYINKEVHQTMALKAPGSNTFLYHSEESIDITDLLTSYDSINIHWCDFVLTSASLERVKETKIPITITLHDMYWLTGSCHYSAACIQFKHGCTSCPLVTGASESITYFNSYHRDILDSLKDLAVISPSEWLCELAAQSQALYRRDIYYIPNPQPTKASKAAKLLRSQGSNTITLIYGAIGLSEKRKGYAVFIELNKELLRRQANVRFKVFGSLTADQQSELQQYPCEVLGYISQRQLAEHFNQSDAMLFLSHEDNYPNLCVEAAAVGLPVIASNNSGLKSFIETSEGGLLTSNNPVEIAIIIESLSKHDMNRLGERMAEWYTKVYSSITLESAYQSVLYRSDHSKDFIYESNRLNHEKKKNEDIEGKLKCKYIKNISEFAVEILVPQKTYQNNMFSMSYSLSNPGQPLDVFIDGNSYERPVNLNSDGLTYTMGQLPAGKIIKLVRHDPNTQYYYNKLDISNISTYPSGLGINTNDNRPNNNSGLTSVERDSCFLVCDDSLAFEYYEGDSLYWLLAHKNYSIHFFQLPPKPSQSSSGYDDKTLICFAGIDIRHVPVRGIRLVANVDNEVFSFEPIIEDTSLSFSVATHMLHEMSSAFLATGSGEKLDDGREVIALIKKHTIVTSSDS